MHICIANPWHPVLRYVRTAKVAFEVAGGHTTLVYEPMRELLWLFQRYRLGGVYLPALLKTAVCMLCALDYLHTVSDYSH